MTKKRKKKKKKRIKADGTKYKPKDNSEDYKLKYQTMQNKEETEENKTETWKKKKKKKTQDGQPSCNCYGLRTSSSLRWSVTRKRYNHHHSAHYTDDRTVSGRQAASTVSKSDTSTAVVSRRVVCYT